MREFSLQERYWLWLNSVTGVQPKLFHQLISFAGDIGTLYERAARKDLGELPCISDTIREKLMQTAHEGYIEQYVRWLKSHKVDVVIEESPAYPTLLREIYQPPTVLFINGRLPKEFMLPIGMVGTRDSTDYGKRIATKLAKELVQSGATIISGMARGIDRYAALGALSCEAAEFPTVAVLGSGVDVIYPSTNTKLYHQIAERGAVISEFLPGTRPHRGNFPIRNRIISGLSKGVVVVEAAERSGASITANTTLEQNRDLFAVPGEVDRPQSAGTNGLIRAGCAKPVFCTEDILEEYGVQVVTVPEVKVEEQSLPPIQKEIYQALKAGPRSADELCDILSFSSAQVNSALTSMQFSGIMKQLPGRIYSLC